MARGGFAGKTEFCVSDRLVSGSLQHGVWATQTRMRMCESASTLKAALSAMNRVAQGSSYRLYATLFKQLN